MFQHRKLIVYQRALPLTADVFALTLRLQRGQPQRAGVSMLLNIAEGAAEFSGAEKARFYRIARRSAAEVASALDLLSHLKAIAPEDNARTQAELDQIAAMLTAMVKVSAARDATHVRNATNSRSRPRPRSP